MSTTTTSRCLRALAAGGLAAIAVLALSAPASAHAGITSTQPAPLLAATPDDEAPSPPAIPIPYGPEPLTVEDDLQADRDSVIVAEAEVAGLPWTIIIIAAVVVGALALGYNMVVRSRRETSS